MSSQQPQEGELFVSLTQPTTEEEQQSLTSPASTPVTTISDSTSDEAIVVIDQQDSNDEKDGDALKNDCSENKAFLDVQMVSSQQQVGNADEALTSGQQIVESLDDSSNNSMETGATDTSSMITNVTSVSEMTENSTASMEEEETSSLVAAMADVVPTPTDKGVDTSLFETIESPNKRVRQDSNEQQSTEDNDENTQEVSPSELEEPTAKKVKSNPNETSMISDTATDGSANTSSATIVCEEDDEIEVTLVYEDKERAITFYKTVFEVEIVDQPEETETKPVEEGSESAATANQSDAQQPDDVKIKGFKLNAKLSPKKKVQALPRTPRIFVPSEKLQMTLDRVKGFEGACVEECLDFTCITCPEGNKLTLVKIDV